MQPDDAKQTTTVEKYIRGPSLRYDEAFELTQHGRMNYLTLVSCCFIFVYCSQEMNGIAYIVTPAECDLHFTIKQRSLINSGVFIGIVTVAMFWGMICDYWGRRKVMLPTLFLAIISSFISALCTNFWFLFLTRVLTGCLVAASSATVLVYLGEFHSSKYRDRAISITVASDQVNFVLLPGLAWVILPQSFKLYIGKMVISSWRVFMMLWGIPGIIGATILLFLPESPKFILATQGVDEARAILAIIYACNTKSKPEDYPVGHIIADTSLTSLHKGVKARLREVGQLMKPPIRRCFILTHLCMLIVNLLCNGLYIWLPTIMNETLKDISSNENLCTLIHDKYMETFEHGISHDWNPEEQNASPLSDDDVDCSVKIATYPMSMAMEMVYLVPFLLVIYCIAKVKLTKLYASVMCICGVNLALCSVIPQTFVGFLLITIGLCSGSCACILNAMAVDAFPTRLRALSLCTMDMAGQLGTVIGICILSYMKGVYCPVIFFLVSFLVFLSAFCLVWFWPDMRKVREIMEARHYTY